MPILRAKPPSVEVNIALARTLWQWLVLGALAVALVPAARGHSVLLGFLPFWLLLAPIAALIALYRNALTAAWRARLVLATPRRRRRNGVRVHLSFPRQPARRPAPRGKINAL
jgi:hypothetical protein